MNEHQKVSCFNCGKTSMHTIFKLKSTNINLPSCLICFSDNMADLALWLVRLPVNQTPGEGSFRTFWEEALNQWCELEGGAT